MFKTLRHPRSRRPKADPARFYFGALTPAMADHLRDRTFENAAERRRETERSRGLRRTASWLPIKDWQD